MDEKTTNILDLNHDCMLVIIKDIIADCELRGDPKNPSMYADIEIFALLHENIKELLKMRHTNVYYHRQMTIVARSQHLIINFAHKDEGDAYWELYTKAIRENITISHVKMIVDPAFSYPEFPKHFQMIKCALENKKFLTSVKLALNGYTLDDLNNIADLTHLYLDVRMSAKALISVCKLSPKLNTLELRSTEMNERLSDIVPHSRNLECLSFVPKPNVDGSEYAPLAQLPRLRELTIYGAYTNGMLLTMFQAMKDWRSAGNQTLTVHFTEKLPHLSNVTIVTSNSLQYFEFSKSGGEILLKASYNFDEILKDGSSLHQSLATITLISANFRIIWPWRKLILDGCAAADISELISLLNLFDISSLALEEYDDKETSIPKLFGSMIPDGLLALKPITINPGKGKIDTLNLENITSIRFLECNFSDWESIDLLNQLTKLQTLIIDVKKHFENKYSKVLCNLIDTCPVCAFIKCKDWRIEFKKNEKTPFRSNGINTLKIFDEGRTESLNEVLEALKNKTFNPNDEVDISHLINLYFKDIYKVSEIKTLKKLRICLKDTNGIEKLSALTELEELTICLEHYIHMTNGSLIQLFDKLAIQETPSLKSLRVKSKDLDPEEVFKVSKISSLKKLQFCGGEYCASWTELANSNIEQLTIKTNSSVQKLFEAFAISNTTRLHHLKIKCKTLNGLELEGISKLNTLRSLNFCPRGLQNLKFVQKLQNLKNLSILHVSIGSRECECLRELKNLESLTLCLNQYEGLHVLADMKCLKELIIQKSRCLFSAQAFACKGGLNLERLTLPICHFQELKEVEKIKSLKHLHLCLMTHLDFDEGPYYEPIELPQLESLYLQKEGRIRSWLVVLESFKNLKRCTIECQFDEEKNTVRNVKTLLKSMRDPALQDPLILTVIFNTIHPNSHVEHFDDDYLKTYYSFKEYENFKNKI